MTDVHLAEKIAAAKAVPGVHSVIHPDLDRRIAVLVPDPGAGRPPTIVGSEGDCQRVRQALPDSVFQWVVEPPGVTREIVSVRGKCCAGEGA
jgi:hypothetical protein